jgi:hypothetical protein
MIASVQTRTSASVPLPVNRRSCSQLLWCSLILSMVTSSLAFVPQQVRNRVNVFEPRDQSLAPPLLLQQVRSTGALFMGTKTGGKLISTLDEYTEFVTSTAAPRPVLVFFTAPWCGPVSPQCPNSRRRCLYTRYQLNCVRGILFLQKGMSFVREAKHSLLKQSRVRSAHSFRSFQTVSAIHTRGEGGHESLCGSN